MERLVTTSQAAEILGLSLQGVHYRIKKEQLKSVKKDGKTFVYVDDEQNTSHNFSNVKVENSKQNNFDNFQSVIDVKNEQIEILKKSISEIFRLEKNQNKIIEVFNSEISLLQSAFNEMRSIYKPQIEQNIKTEKQSHDLIKVKDFFILMKRYNKTENEIKAMIFDAIKSGDKRFIYNKVEKKLLILNDDFRDLI